MTGRPQRLCAVSIVPCALPSQHFFQATPLTIANATKDFIFFPYSFSSLTPLLLYSFTPLPPVPPSLSLLFFLLCRKNNHPPSAAQVINRIQEPNQVGNLDRRNQKSRLSRLNRAVSGTLHCSLLYQQTSLLFVLNCSALPFASN